MSIRDQVKQIAREVVGQSVKPKYRLGYVSDLNDDGVTVSVMLDGNAVNANPLYPVIKGQQVALLINDDGSINAVPTKPTADPVPIIHPPFFSGGVNRFLANQFIQDLGNRNVYRIDAPDLPGYFPMGSAISPDGLRVCIAWGNQNFGSGNTPDVHYRVYKVGPVPIKLAEVTTGSLHPLFTITAKLLFEVVRTQYTAISSPPTPPYQIALSGNVGTSFNHVISLTLDKNALFFAEVQFNQAVVNQPNGTIYAITQLYKSEFNPVPNTVTTNMIGQWQSWFVATVTTMTGTTSSPRSVFYHGAAGAIGGTNALLVFPGVVDPDHQEMVGLATDPLGTNSLSNFDINGPIMPRPEGRIMFVQPNGPSIAASSWTELAFPHLTYPAVTIGLGPNPTQIALAGWNNQNAPHSTPASEVARNGPFSVMTYQGTQPTPIEDFARAIFKSVIQNVTSYVQVKFSNSISGDPFILPGGQSTIQPSNLSPFIMLISYGGVTFPLSNPNMPALVGYWVDLNGRLRRVTTKDGKTFDIATQLKDFFQNVSPGETDPTVLKISQAGFGNRSLYAAFTQ